jgi:hypothetical protein
MGRSAEYARVHCVSAAAAAAAHGVWVSQHLAGLHRLDRFHTVFRVDVLALLHHLVMRSSTTSDKVTFERAPNFQFGHFGFFLWIFAPKSHVDWVLDPTFT